jgi:RNA polymerase sigma-70 factor (sigma-E family)
VNGIGPDFEDYVRDHGRALEKYAYVLTGHPAEAQDLVQTALTKAYRRWRRVSAVEHPDAYVRRIVTNCYLDQRRRRSSSERPTAQLSDSAGAPAFAGSKAFADPAEQVVSRDAIVRALQTLSPHQRAVLVLRHFLDLDDEAIATEMGCGRATVRSHASRGLDRMRNELGQQDRTSMITRGTP